MDGTWCRGCPVHGRLLTPAWNDVEAIHRDVSWTQRFALPLPEGTNDE